MRAKKTRYSLLSNELEILGLAGFEPATPSPPDLYAKPLRYSPIAYRGHDGTMEAPRCQGAECARSGIHCRQLR